MSERKIYILDEEECTPCEEVKAALEKEIAEGKVQILDITTDEALELLEKAGAGDKVEFPAALVEDEQGVRLCQIYHSQDITLSKCGDEIIAIREPEGEEIDQPKVISPGVIKQEPEEPPPEPSD